MYINTTVTGRRQALIELPAYQQGMTKWTGERCEQRTKIVPVGGSRR